MSQTFVAFLLQPMHPLVASSFLRILLLGQLSFLLHQVNKRRWEVGEHWLDPAVKVSSTQLLRNLLFGNLFFCIKLAKEEVGDGRTLARPSWVAHSFSDWRTTDPAGWVAHWRTTDR